jgi:prostaglandin-H2 D-isomerase / glutathione transferase
MPSLKLSYFDFHGGRGEPARLALSMGGIPFEDDRVPPSEWERRKPNTPFGALPVLEVDGQTLAQSNAINRYVGKLADFYPTDAWQAGLCDEVMEAMEDINTKLAPTFSFPTRKRKPSAKRWPKARSRSISRACSSGSKHMEAATSLRTV